MASTSKASGSADATVYRKMLEGKITPKEYAQQLRLAVRAARNHR